MSYWYRTELDAPPKRPLLLYLHGYGESGGDNVAQTTKHGPWSAGEHNAKVSEELRGFFRASPHIPQKGDQWNADMLRDLVLSIREQHADVAQDRLFVVGISRGGWGALEFAAAHGQALGIAGMVVCCPEHIERLNAALAVTPVYLFHGDGDNVVLLDEARSQVYKNLAGRANFRWVRVRPDRTIGERRHNCWTYLFGHPGIYHWFAGLANDPNYRNQKDAWPDFADLSVPAPSAEQATGGKPPESSQVNSGSEAET